MTKAEWFQLWTALAVTGGAIGTFFVYRLGRQQTTVLGPTINVSTRGKGGHPNVIAHLEILGPDNIKWQITNISVKSPRSARIGEPERELGVESPANRKRIRVAGPIDTIPLVISSTGAHFVALEVKMALKAEPKITSRFTTHIKMPI